MLPLQITSSLRALTKLSSLHSVRWGLFVRRFRSSPFRISNFEPLFAKHPGGGTPTSTPSLSAVCQVLCCSSHTRNPCIFMHLRTLLCNGNPLFPLFSMLSALFLSSWGVVPPSTSARVERLQPRHSRRQDYGVVMGNCLNGDHRIHSRGAWKGRSVHDIQVANLPRLALGISCGGLG
jgi:hypothetical protein